MNQIYGETSPISKFIWRFIDIIIATELHINDNIKSARKLAGYKSQEAIAQALGLTRDAYKEWENETMPQADILHEISKLVGVSMEDLLKRPGDNSPAPKPQKNKKPKDLNDLGERLRVIEGLISETRDAVLKIASGEGIPLYQKPGKKKGKIL